MKLYHISQNKVNGYDTYSDAVVAALNEDTARRTHPAYEISSTFNADGVMEEYDYGTWVLDIKDVSVEYLGEAILV